MPSHNAETWARRSCFRCQAGSGGDRNDCDATLKLEYSWGIKGKSERFVVFTRMNLFLEKM